MISYLFFCSPVDEACLPEPSHITLQLPHQLLLVGELLSPKERAITKHPYSYSLFNLSHVMSRQCMHALGMALSASPWAQPHLLKRGAARIANNFSFLIPKHWVRVSSPHPRKERGADQRKFPIATSIQYFVIHTSWGRFQERGRTIKHFFPTLKSSTSYLLLDEEADKSRLVRVQPNKFFRKD